MTTIDTRPEHGAAALTGNGTGSAALAGLTGWITTADHKRIGRLFVGFALVLATGALVLGGLVGIERIDPDGAFLPSDAVDQLVSLYRVAIPFFVVAPLLLGLGIAVVPLQLGARGIAFGRLAALGFWSWLFGTGATIVAFVGNGGPAGGDPKMVELFLTALGLAIVGLIAAAISLATTVLTGRAPGMTVRRVPAFAWASLVGATATIVTLPVLLGDLMLLTVDHRSARTPGFGSNQDLLGWMGWGLTQPLSYLLAIPVLGIVADIVATAARRRVALRDPLFIGIGLLAVGVLGAVTQKLQTVAWSGASTADKINDLIPFALFTLLPILGPVVVLGVIGQLLASGKPRLASPPAFLFALLGLLLFIVGVAAHALTPLLDLQLLGTTYEEGVLAFVAGGAVLVSLGGICHWGPKLWGRKLPSGAVLPLVGLGAIGVLLAGAPLLVAGFQGQPALATGGFDYELAPEALNLLSAIGAGLLLLTIVGFAALALKGFTTGQPSGDDPWDGATLEWATTSPAPADNFAEIHRVSSAEPLLDMKPAGSDA